MRDVVVLVVSHDVVGLSTCTCLRSLLGCLVPYCELDCRDLLWATRPHLRCFKLQCSRCGSLAVHGYSWTLQTAWKIVVYQTTFRRVSRAYITPGRSRGQYPPFINSQGSYLVSCMFLSMVEIQILVHALHRHAADMFYADYVGLQELCWPCEGDRYLSAA